MVVKKVTFKVGPGFLDKKIHLFWIEGWTGGGRADREDGEPVHGADQHGTARGQAGRLHAQASGQALQSSRETTSMYSTSQRSIDYLKPDTKLISG